jgi:hypothetical protein
MGGSGGGGGGGGGVLWYAVVVLVLLCMVLVSPVGADEEKKKPRAYEKQFPDGSENLPMPGLVLFSIFMGEIHYPHVPFLLASMKWNPDIKFVVINIYNESKTSLSQWKQHVREHDVPNLYIEYLSHKQFSDVVKDRLNVDVPLTDEWYYKLCDFKPTLAYLFPQHTNEALYKYWGYADLDVVWGNISRFSYLFQNGRPFVISGWWHTTGALNMFINQDWTRGLFLSDPKYVPLLTNITYRNLDENGGFINPQNVVDDGQHAMMYLESNCKQCKEYQAKGNHFNRGRNPDDTLFIGPGEYDWGGHSIWQHGSLTMPAGNKVFPPGRELMFWHVRSMHLNIDTDPVVRHGLIQDMITYGYTIPHFYPLFTRYACRNEQLNKGDFHSFHPYAQDCFASKMHHEHNKQEQ